jgi:hypothetical protein
MGSLFDAEGTICLYLLTSLMLLNISWENKPPLQLRHVPEGKLRTLTDCNIKASLSIYR